MATLYDILVAAGEATMSKSEFGRVMHDPDATEEEKTEALAQMAEAGGYEYLPED